MSHSVAYIVVSRNHSGRNDYPHDPSMVPVRGSCDLPAMCLQD